MKKHYSIFFIILYKTILSACKVLNLPVKSACKASLRAKPKKGSVQMMVGKFWLLKNGW